MTNLSIGSPRVPELPAILRNPGSQDNRDRGFARKPVAMKFYGTETAIWLE
jgi:hypothetical protein